MSSSFDTCFIGNVSINSCFSHLFEGPLPELTDNESGEDNEDFTKLLSVNTSRDPPESRSQLENTSSLSRADKQKARKKWNRKMKRANVQEEKNCTMKQVAKKRRFEASKNLIEKKEFSIMTCPNVTLPAWVGKRKDFPKETFTQDQLIKDYGMENIQWDGK